MCIYPSLADHPHYAAINPPKVNLRDALLRTIAYDAPNGKQYRLKEKVATLLVRWEPSGSVRARACACRLGGGAADALRMRDAVHGNLTHRHRFQMQAARVAHGHI